MNSKNINKIKIINKIINQILQKFIKENNYKTTLSNNINKIKNNNKTKNLINKFNYNKIKSMIKFNNKNWIDYLICLIFNNKYKINNKNEIIIYRIYKFQDKK